MTATPPGADEKIVDPPLVPLSRNRNYNLLWTSRLVSELGSEIAFIAFPLLILAVSGSAWEMSAVSAVIAGAQMLANVPAGIVADRWDRRKVMITCEILRAIAMGSVAVSLLLDAYSFPHILVVAAIEGMLVSVFGPAEDAALSSVVAESQLSNAIARNTARTYIANLAGPAASGVLFTLHRMIPFLLDAIMLLCSAVALFFLRIVPGRSAAGEPDEESAGELEKAPRNRVRSDIANGFRWVLGQRAIRASLAWVTAFQFVFSALIIIVLAVSGEEDTGPGEIGLMMACFGAGGLLGSMLAARLNEVLSARVIVIGFSWVALGLLLVMSVVPAGLPLGLMLGAIAFGMPTAVTAVMTYQLIVTPDELRGRLSSIVGVCTGAAGALGPLLGGLLMSLGGGGSAILSCAIGIGVVAVLSSVSPSLRGFVLPEGAVEELNENAS